MLFCHHCGRLLGAGKVYKIMLDNGDIYSYFHGTNLEGFFNQPVADGILSACSDCYSHPGRAVQTVAERDTKKMADWPRHAQESRNDSKTRLGENILTELDIARQRFREPSAADLAALSKRRLA